MSSLNPANLVRCRVALRAQWSEACANIFGKELRLFAGRKVSTHIVLLVIDELGIRFFGPASWRSCGSAKG